MLRAVLLHRLPSQSRGPVLNRDGAADLVLALVGPSILKKGHEGNVEEWIMRKYEDLVVRVQRHRKEDLQLVSTSPEAPQTRHETELADLWTTRSRIIY